jgi:hypothetical protein
MIRKIIVIFIFLKTGLYDSSTYENRKLNYQVPRFYVRSSRSIRMSSFGSIALHNLHFPLDCVQMIWGAVH